MTSLNHGYLQIKIGAFFLAHPQLTPSSELTLDVSALSEIPDLGVEEIPTSLEPDIAVYRERSIDFQNDILKAKQMPLLAVEILSPRQGAQSLIDKFRLYFALGIQSCWLVYPYAKAITVYRAPDDFETFGKGELVDDVVGVRFSLDEIFS